MHIIKPSPNKMLHLAQAMVHSLIWKSLDVFRVIGVQRWSMASDLCRDSVMPHSASSGSLPLIILCCLFASLQPALQGGLSASRPTISSPLSAVTFRRTQGSNPFLFLNCPQNMNRWFVQQIYFMNTFILLLLYYTVLLNFKLKIS